MKRFVLFAAAAAGATAPALADNLYRGSNWPALSSDRRASQPGDLVTVVVFQSAESSNVQQNASGKNTALSGAISGGHLDEKGALSFGGTYNGRGELTRSQKFVTQMSVTVLEVLPNGDLVIGGDQYMQVNGDKTKIGVRGRIRPEDIGSDNSVLSTRIADAQIDYDGRGFVSRSAKPGLIDRIFSFLGLL